MPSTCDTALVLFPGALGDFICFLPALAALRTRHAGRMLVAAKPALLELLPPSFAATVSIDRREMADLFGSDSPPSPESQKLFGGFAAVHSWTGFGNRLVAQRLATITGGRVNVYRFRGMEPGEHAVDYYARCAGVVPISPIASILRDDAEWFDNLERSYHLREGFLVVHAGSGSAKKNWRGFEAVLRSYRGHGISSVVLRGPAEAERWGTDCGADIVLDGVSLPQVAALLRRCRTYIGNDSGISHLAGAVGAPGLVLFGPTDPAMWAPRGQLRVVRASGQCERCGPDVFCEHQLPVEAVIGALETVNKAAAAHP